MDQRQVEDFFRRTHEKMSARFLEANKLFGQIFPVQAKTMSTRDLEDYATQQEQQCAHIFVQYVNVANPEDIQNFCYPREFYGCTKSDFWTWSLFFLCIIFSWICGFMVSKFLYKRNHGTTAEHLRTTEVDVRPTTTWIPRRKTDETYDTLPPTYETVVEK